MGGLQIFKPNDDAVQCLDGLLDGFAERLAEQAVLELNIDQRDQFGLGLP